MRRELGGHSRPEAQSPEDSHGDEADKDGRRDEAECDVEKIVRRTQVCLPVFGLPCNTQTSDFILYCKNHRH